MCQLEGSSSRLLATNTKPQKGPDSRARRDGSEPIPVFRRFGGGNFPQHRLKCLVIRLFRTVLNVASGLQNRQFFSGCSRNELIHGNAVIRRNTLDMGADRFRQMNGNKAHGDFDVMLRTNSAGVNTSRPRLRAGPRSRTLPVTMWVALPATASSTSMSSSGSCRKGRHEK